MAFSLATLWSNLVYEPCCSLFGGNADIFLFVFGTQLLHLLTFWLHSLPLLIIDWFPEHFSSLRLWRSQRDVELSREKMMKAVSVALFNQLIVGTAFSIPMFFIFKWRGMMFRADEVPTLLESLVQITIFIAIEEIGFYYGHRLMHRPELYARFHKMHHEFTAPIGCAAIYAHPVEHILCNLSPLIAGPLIMKSHVIVYWFWLTAAVFSTITAHSGFHFPFLPSNEFHDYHHLKFSVNFGALGIMDRLHKTDELFLNTSQWRRHFTFFSFADVKHMGNGHNSKLLNKKNVICSKIN
jgi:sterol desaturase/sphingolipid hydroxylase (fatty acid hydroxylase superfamily)